MSNILAAILALLLIGWGIYRAINNAKTAANNLAKAQQFLRDNATREGVYSTDSGLQYLVLTRGDSQHRPMADSRVTVHYHGTLSDGTVFDSSIQRGEPISFTLNQVIKGWTEGLQLMSPGDKYRLFIPPQLAYGRRSMGAIAANSALIFDVELLSYE
ncbi:FKBP-type peptidyl-prolyl cis-trans isomerase [Sinobacterium caligoides]|uniref:FKBP-type peptidyl-prolyl cis-trans isomerase n=1 Tax=Sinobacterium caligoides TaxID=933926 RepID=UPI0013C3787A|nr:FKBP-type peptidyl-prolyl cis-trans isomerase [Sinobacterium caligoides]